MEKFNIPVQGKQQPTPIEIRAIQQAVKNQFGVGGVATRIALSASIRGIPNRSQNNADNYLIPSSSQDVALGTSELGTPYWTNLKVLPLSYTDPITQEFISVDEQEYITCLITITGSKNVIKTPIQGRNGTIKEYIAQNDYSINIKGGIFGANGVRPSDKINLLNQLWKANVSLKVVSPILKEWNINNIVIESINIPEIEGGYSYQLFDINAVSDEDLIIDLSGQ